MGKLLADMTNIELAIQRLEKMGFDQPGIVIILREKMYYWIFTATEKEINDWYDNFTK